MRLNALCILAASIDFSVRCASGLQGGNLGLTIMVQDISFNGLMLLAWDCKSQVDMDIVEN